LYVARLNPVVNRGEDGVNIGDGASIEPVDRFCYLGDVLSIDGSVDAAVMARIQSGWNKFRLTFKTTK